MSELTENELRTRIAELEAQIQFEQTSHDTTMREREKLEQQLEAQQRAGVPDGWKLVPVEITEAMKSAGMDVLMNQTDIYADDYGNVTVETITPRRIYTAMLAAAPAPNAKEQAEHKLSAAGVFKGAEGLRGLLDAQDFWDQQPYGTRLYFGEMANEYLHRDVLRAAVALLDQRQEQAPQPAEVESNERAQFEAWITSPPLEKPVHRNPESSGFPGQYRAYEVQLAWDAWQASRAAQQQEGLKVVEPVRNQALPGSREAEMVVLETDDEGNPTIWCDPEIADLVRALNVGGLRTVASCSGHGEKPFGIVTLKDGRELLVLPDFETTRIAERALGVALAAQQQEVKSD